MSKKRLALDWSIKAGIEDFKPTLIRYRKYLKDRSNHLNHKVTYDVAIFVVLGLRSCPISPILLSYFLGLDAKRSLK